jgi:hypothetical protein
MKMVFNVSLLLQYYYSSMPFIRPPFLERRKGFIREVVSFVEAADWSLNITIHLQSGLLSEVVFVERGHVRGRLLC